MLLVDVGFRIFGEVVEQLLLLRWKALEEQRTPRKLAEVLRSTERPRLIFDRIVERRGAFCSGDLSLFALIGRFLYFLLRRTSDNVS